MENDKRVSFIRLLTDRTKTNDDEVTEREERHSRISALPQAGLDEKHRWNL